MDGELIFLVLKEEKLGEKQVKNAALILKTNMGFLLKLELELLENLIIQMVLAINTAFGIGKNIKMKSLLKMLQYRMEL